MASRSVLIAYIALFASCLFVIAGQLLLKWTMSNADRGFFDWVFLLRLALALGTYVLGTVNWIIALRSVKLSLAYPLTSLNYVGILLGSYYFFNEQITPVRIAGVFLIFIGVVFVALSASMEKAPNEHREILNPVPKASS